MAKQNGKQRQNLGAGIELAIDAGPEIAHAEANEEDGRDDQNAQIAAEDKNGDPPGHQPLVHEDQEEGAEQKLVRDRIKVLADLGLLLEQPRGPTIEPIAESSDHEEAKRGGVVGLKHRDNEKGYEAQTKESQQIGGCTQFFQQRIPILEAQSANLDGT